MQLYSKAIRAKGDFWRLGRHGPFGPLNPPTHVIVPDLHGAAVACSSLVISELTFHELLSAYKFQRKFQRKFLSFDL